MINEIECFIDEYAVQVSAHPTAGSYNFTFVDDCRTLRDDCRMKAYLLKVAQDWLVTEGSDQNVYAACSGEKSACPGMGDGVTFDFSNKRLTVATSPAITEYGPAFGLVATIPLPYQCDVPVVFP